LDIASDGSEKGDKEILIVNLDLAYLTVEEFSF